MEEVTICPICKRELKTNYEKQVIKECILCRYERHLDIEQYHAITKSILNTIYETISKKYTKIEEGVVVTSDVDPKTAYIDCIGMIVNLLDILSQTSDKISILTSEMQLLFDEIYTTSPMEKTNEILDSLKKFQEDNNTTKE